MWSSVSDHAKSVYSSKHDVEMPMLMLTSANSLSLSGRGAEYYTGRTSYQRDLIAKTRINRISCFAWRYQGHAIA